MNDDNILSKIIKGSANSFSLCQFKLLFHSCIITTFVHKTQHLLTTIYQIQKQGFRIKSGDLFKSVSRTFDISKYN